MTPENILKGAVFSFHSAWSFLRDAILLYRNDRYSGACVLGTISGEHLGQCQWLLNIWRKSFKRSINIDCRRFRTELERDHQQMLKDGLVSLQSKVPQRLSQLGIRLAELKPEDPEYSSVAEEYSKSHEKILRRAPEKFYELRISAQYVKPTEDCRRWILPAAIDPAEVHDLLLNVGNCYRVFLYFRFLKEPLLLQAISNLGVKADLEDVKSTWPSPESDAFQK